MAQTKRKRRRKHRGTQGGRIDTRPSRGRPRSRAEAKSRARSRRSKPKSSGPRVPSAPSWSSALKKGAFASALFIVVLTVFGQSPAASVLTGIVLLGFYVLLAYTIERLVYQRHLRKEAKKRLEREEQRAGHEQARS